jgi:hypothetical protein
MAKAILEFDLNEPDDKEAHKRAVKALDMAIALWDIEQYLRAETKYNEELTQDAYDALATAREKFYQILNEHNINMDEILK